MYWRYFLDIIENMNVIISRAIFDSSHRILYIYYTIPKKYNELLLYIIYAFFE